MKVLLLIIIVFFFQSCGSRHSISSSDYIQGDRDSLLVTFLQTQFDAFGAPSVKAQVDYLRQLKPNTTYTKALSGTFNQYKIESFQFDSQGYPPFAVEISDKNGLLFLFTFTDELYYLRNNVVQDFVRLDSLVIADRRSGDSLVLEDVYFERNFERNLNALIVKLNIQDDDDAIKRLIDLLCRQLLEMSVYQDSELASVMAKLDGEPDAVELMKSDYKQFMQTEGDYVFRYRSRQGYMGYWKIWVAKDGDAYCVKVRFFSRILFYAFFM
jgi:hypothetical protein